MTEHNTETIEGPAAMDTILIIGGRLEAIEKAKKLGLRVVLLQHKDRLLPGQAETADALLLVDYLDWEVTRPIVRAAHEAYGFTAVMTLIEQATELAGRINEMLGLGSTTYEVAHRFRDKLSMRARLRETGFETVASAPVDSAEDVRNFAGAHGYPVFVKPVDGTASRGAARIDGPEQADAMWGPLTGLRERGDLPMAGFYPVGDFVVEEYLDGTEYSAESFSFNGSHIVVAVTGKFQNNYVEMGHALPAIIDEETERTVVDYVCGFLTAMGLKDGVGHTEVRLTPRGPRIIEGHDRVAGDRLLDLMAAIYGVDLEQYASGWPFGLVPELTRRPEPALGSATKWISAEPGTVTAIEGVEEVRAHPGVLGVDVHLEVGAEVERMDDNFGRHVQVLVTAEDTAAAVELCDSLMEKITVTSRPATR